MLVLFSHQPSVVVRCNPLLFELPEADATHSKENSSPSQGPLHRSIFAVLTLDSILIYDTHHLEPLSTISGLHYAGLTDCCWSRDGMNLIVSSSDGYMSIIRFEDGELGKVLQQPEPEEVLTLSSTPQQPQQSQKIVIKAPEMTIPPCEPGSAILEGPPAKKSKKTRVTPTLISSSPSENVAPPVVAEKSSICKETERVGDAVTRLSLGGEGENPPPKKKKRVQPLLVSN